tara:strand:- start:935 stop:1555 length:621 start_codon:yes stop_codon:yes gene_type:complete
MSQTPPLADSKSKTDDVYKKISDFYSLEDKNNRILGLKNLEYQVNYLSDALPFVLEFELESNYFTDFFENYGTSNLWFTDSECERVTEREKKSTYYKTWFVIDNFVEDALRTYQRAFALPPLYGMFEVYDVCSTTHSLTGAHKIMYPNFKVCCLLNFGQNSLKNCFLNQSDIELKPNCLYLFPACFTHIFNFDASEKCLVFLTGAA